MNEINYYKYIKYKYKYLILNNDKQIGGTIEELTTINDGTSNTLLVGEKAFNNGLGTNPQAGEDEGWTAGWDWDTIRWGRYQPVKDYSDSSTDAVRAYYLDMNKSPLHLMGAFGSAHPGGFNSVLADGSVKNIPYSIPLGVFQRFSCRNDGEVINLD